MALFDLKKTETRSFNYKPRYYKPEEEQSTGDSRRDFANELHREWSSKRKHDKNENHTPWITILTMLFFAVVLAFVYFKFFSH